MCILDSYKWIRTHFINLLVQVWVSIQHETEWDTEAVCWGESRYWCEWADLSKTLSGQRRQLESSYPGLVYSSLFWLVRKHLSLSKTITGFSEKGRPGIWFSRWLEIACRCEWKCVCVCFRSICHPCDDLRLCPHLLLLVASPATHPPVTLHRKSSGR